MLHENNPLPPSCNTNLYFGKEMQRKHAQKRPKHFTFCNYSYEKFKIPFSEAAESSCGQMCDTISLWTCRRRSREGLVSVRSISSTFRMFSPEILYNLEEVWVDEFLKKKQFAYIVHSNRYAVKLSQIMLCKASYQRLLTFGLL